VVEANQLIERRRKKKKKKGNHGLSSARSPGGAVGVGSRKGPALCPDNRRKQVNYHNQD
jgi:hypothetical protein